MLNWHEVQRPLFRWSPKRGYTLRSDCEVEMRKVPVDCRATIGEVGNNEHSLRSLVKLVHRVGVELGRQREVWL